MDARAHHDRDQGHDGLDTILENLFSCFTSMMKIKFIIPSLITGMISDVIKKISNFKDLGVVTA